MHSRRRHHLLMPYACESFLLPRPAVIKSAISCNLYLPPLEQTVLILIHYVVDFLQQHVQTGSPPYLALEFVENKS